MGDVKDEGKTEFNAPEDLELQESSKQKSEMLDSEEAEGSEEVKADDNSESASSESTGDTRPSKLTKSDKTDKTVKASKAGRVLTVLVTVILMLGAMVGGVVLGRTFGGAEYEEEVDGAAGGGAGENVGGSSGVLGDALLGGGGGVPVGEVALMPEDDKLTLAFLKMHNTRENSSYSPLSIRYALEMMREGAEGETKAQIEALLGKSDATHYEEVADHLAVANSLWVRAEWKDRVRPEFMAKLNETLGAEMIIDDFASAKNINEWVERNTLGLIKDITDDASVQGLEAALINALAIDMEWATKYKPESTLGEYFDEERLTQEERNDYENRDQYLYTIMSRQGGEDVYYNLAADATVLAQDLKEYNGTQLQFVAIMPKDLESYVKDVSNEDINRLLRGLRIAVGQNDTYIFRFTSYLPKFSIESGIDDLIADLEELGVVDAFSREKANFAGIVAEDNQFFVSSMAHKTKFDLSEEGIRAAAVTLLGFGGAGGGIMNQVSVVVAINRPFMYLVRDKKTGEIWFAGTVYEPNRWIDDKDQYKFN